MIKDFTVVIELAMTESKVRAGVRRHSLGGHPAEARARQTSPTIDQAMPTRRGLGTRRQYRAYDSACACDDSTLGEDDRRPSVLDPTTLGARSLIRPRDSVKTEFSLSRQTCPVAIIGEKKIDPRK